MTLDPRIGLLNRGKHYAYVNGYDKEAVLGKCQEVEMALGLRVKDRCVPRPYAVNVTPNIMAYSGGWSGTEYTVEVLAINRLDTIKSVKRERREVDGRNAVLAQYRARLC